MDIKFNLAKIQKASCATLAPLLNLIVTQTEQVVSLWLTRSKNVEQSLEWYKNDTAGWLQIENTSLT